MAYHLNNADEDIDQAEASSFATRLAAARVRPSQLNTLFSVPRDRKGSYRTLSDATAIPPTISTSTSTSTRTSTDTSPTTDHASSVDGGTTRVQTQVASVTLVDRMSQVSRAPVWDSLSCRDVVNNHMTQPFNRAYLQHTISGEQAQTCDQHPSTHTSANGVFATPDLNTTVSSELAVMIATQMPATAHTSKTKSAWKCHLCHEDFGNPRPVICRNNCYDSALCGDCLKDWFIDACKNESKMPPKCCRPIPLTVIAGRLASTEIALFKAKYEEWSTEKKIYCPIPTCSAFISPRLYTTATSSSKAVESTVSCPTCRTSICTKCRGLGHPMEACQDSDLSPELVELLEKWKIKRCPRCKTGVKKVYGCEHIECRCGAHFCWTCLQLMDECDGGCEDEDEDQESEPEEDDVDARAGYFDGDGHDFGQEPEPDMVMPWSCRHHWTPVQPRTDIQSLECQTCFRVVHPQTLSTALKVDGDGDILMSDSNQWQCASNHMQCPHCFRPSPEATATQTDGAYRCWCGESYCQPCHEDEKRKDIEVALECRCGVIVCGLCKHESRDEDGD